MRQFKPQEYEFPLPIAKNTRSNDHKKWLRKGRIFPDTFSVHGCKGFCGMVEFKDKHDPHKSPYYSYGKYCSKCEIYLQRNIELIRFCPCCGVNLRVKPRNKKRNIDECKED